MGIWIDTDMGFDDIAAILTVAAAGFEIDGMSLVFGNAVLAQVERNAAGAAKAFCWSMPIHSGADRAVIGTTETASSILSEAGMPTAGLSLPEAGLPPTAPALEALCGWLGDGAGEKRILALGPLTNIAILCLARPDLAKNITEIVWMGGGVSLGNHTASAEFNALADPEAAAIVLSRAVPLTMADLDFCRKVRLRADDIRTLRLRAGRNAALLADLTEGFLSIALKRGASEMPFFDPAAAIAFCHPTLVSLQPVRIDIETAGTLTRGRTVVETRPHKAKFNARIISDVDADTAHDLIMIALASEAAR
ncbi:nucleoside hydrolase [Martelella endophytica]|uniref:Nucleoside hydrolase n=1 Tax=Martelella endophytica TaxID=1486262 RepID=A0A0D5LX29_MAREN|nr:nucleoside hydrolase [Martelella endophytica]AJY47973.1 nucleoside hydrolase [Martelella endophytica]